MKKAELYLKGNLGNLRGALLSLFLLLTCSNWNGLYAAKNAPSFDCQKAVTPLEKLICSDSDLSNLDAQLAQKYFEIKKTHTIDENVLLPDQREWLKNRYRTCEPNGKDENPSADWKDRYVACLKNLYQQRIRLLDFPELWPPMTEEKTNKAIEHLQNLTAEDVYDLTTEKNRDILAKISCRFFEKDPKAAQRTFGPAFFSGKDSWMPLCSDIKIADRVPQVKDLIQILDSIAGSSDCSGSMRHGYERQEAVLGILAAVDTHPDEQIDARPRTHGYSLAHWAQQGNWEKRQYAVLQATLSIVNGALQSYYTNQFHVEPNQSKELANYYLQQFIDLYTGQTGDSSTLAYPSLCYETRDLDSYLKTGSLPTYDCPLSEYADTSSHATLRRLLGLAIVNDYPLGDIKKLITEKADLDINKSTQTQEESSDTPLMMAAPRAEVIEMLLGAGANPNAQNRFGKTPLMYAVQERNVEGVKRLLRAGADINAKTFDDARCGLRAGNRTALMYAAWQGTPEIVKILIAAKADKSSKDTNGESASKYLSKNESVDKLDQQRMATLFQ